MRRNPLGCHLDGGHWACEQVALLRQQMMSILGSNQCAGSFPELGVTVNDCQWVISELPQSAQTLPQLHRLLVWVGLGQLDPCLASWHPGIPVGAPVCREAIAVRQRLSRVSGRVLIIFRRATNTSVRSVGCMRSTATLLLDSAMCALHRAALCG